MNKKILLSLVTAFIFFTSCNEDTLIHNNESHIDSKKLSYSKNKLWKAGKKIKILFKEGTYEQMTKVEEIASQWLEYANLRFEFYAPGELSHFRADIKVTIGKEVCKGLNHSVVGTDSDSIMYKSTMCISNTDANTILHEFGHAIGLNHEHLHPEFVKKVDDKIVENCIKEQGWSKAKCEKNYKGIGKTGVTHTAYDRNSIMHYSFSPETLKIGSGVSAGGLPILSVSDRFQISRIYPYEELKTMEEIEKEYQEDLLALNERNNCSIVNIWDYPNRINSLNYSLSCTEGQIFQVTVIKEETNSEGELEYNYVPFVDSCYHDIESAIRHMYNITNCQ